MKTLKIEAPKGYEIDKVNSTFENIVFKEIKKEVTERVKTLGDAIQELGENDYEVQQLRKLHSIDSLSTAIIAEQEIVIIVKALNEGWIANWNDSSEYKYFPWFYLGDNFRCDYCDSWCARSGTSSRLCLKTSNLAKYAGEQFTEIYKKFMN